MKVSKRKIELAMAKKCYSASMLAEETNISQVTIARIKNGSQIPRPKTIGIIAKVLEVKIEDLLE